MFYLCLKYFGKLKYFIDFCVNSFIKQNIDIFQGIDEK